MGNVEKKAEIETQDTNLEYLLYTELFEVDNPEIKLLNSYRRIFRERNIDINLFSNLYRGLKIS